MSLNVVGEHAGVEARVNLSRPYEHDGLAEPTCQHVDVGEVACGSPIKQGQQLVAREFFRGKGWPGWGRGGGEVGWRVHGQVNQDPCISTADDDPAERVAFVDPLRRPASLAGRGFQSITRDENLPALRRGEEVEVFRGPRGQVLREEGCSSCEQESLAGRQGEEQSSHFQLESRQIGLNVVCRHYASDSLESAISGAHADRTPRGRTRSCHRSTSSAPST